MVTLRNPFLQQTLEHAGHQLLGFVPGHDRQVVAPGVVKRADQVVHAKVRVPEDEVHLPDAQHMTPGAKALFELLYQRSEWS